MKQSRKTLFVLLALVFLCVSLLAGLAFVSHSCCEMQSQRTCLECAFLQQFTGIFGAIIAAWGVLSFLLPATRQTGNAHAPTLVRLKMRMNN